MQGAAACLPAAPLLWSPARHDMNMQVTKVKLEQKQKEGIAEQRSGRRGPVGSACMGVEQS